VEIDFCAGVCYKFICILLRWSAAIRGGNRSLEPALKIEQAKPWIAAESLEQGAFRRKSSTVFLFCRPALQGISPARVGSSGRERLSEASVSIKRERK